MHTLLSKLIETNIVTILYTINFAEQVMRIIVDSIRSMPYQYTIYTSRCNTFLFALNLAGNGAHIADYVADSVVFVFESNVCNVYI